MNENKKILFIDGKQKLHEKMQEILTDNLPHVSMISATDGPEGITLARELKPNLIISNVALEYASGIDICSTLKSQRETSEIPFIFFTAGSANCKKEALYVGADDCMERSFKSRKIQRLIKNIDTLTSDEWRKYDALYCIETAEAPLLIGKYVQHQKTALDIVAVDSKVIKMKTVFDVSGTLIDELKIMCQNIGEIKPQYGEIVSVRCLELKIPSFYNCITPDGLSLERTPTAEFLERIMTSKSDVILPGYGKPKSRPFFEKYRLN